MIWVESRSAMVGDPRKPVFRCRAGKLPPVKISDPNAILTATNRKNSLLAGKRTPCTETGSSRTPTARTTVADRRVSHRMTFQLTPAKFLKPGSFSVCRRLAGRQATGTRGKNNERADQIFGVVENPRCPYGQGDPSTGDTALLGDHQPCRGPPCNYENNTVTVSPPWGSVIVASQFRPHLKYARELTNGG